MRCCVQYVGLSQNLIKMAREHLENELDFLIQDIKNLKTYEIDRRGRLVECRIIISDRITRDEKELINNAVVKLSDIKNLFVSIKQYYTQLYCV